jgi:hypothetical protein
MNNSFPIQCLISSWLVSIIGIVIGIYFEPEYFARIGSVIVLLAVMSEYALLQVELSRLYESLRGQGAAECGNTGVPDLTPTRWHQRQALMSHITIVIGTLIWGFGDLWLKA